MCDVVQLPGAAQAPVVQPSRRGRLPKAIGSLYVARARRCSREEEAPKIQRQQSFEQASRKERMIALLYSALADVKAGRASALLVALRNCESELDHFACEGVYKDAPEVGADFAEGIAETLREGDWARE